MNIAKNVFISGSDVYFLADVTSNVGLGSFKSSATCLNWDSVSVSWQRTFVVSSATLNPGQLLSDGYLKDGTEHFYSVHYSPTNNMKGIIGKFTEGTTADDWHKIMNLQSGIF